MLSFPLYREDHEPDVRFLAKLLLAQAGVPVDDEDRNEYVIESVELDVFRTVITHDGGKKTTTLKAQFHRTKEK